MGIVNATPDSYFAPSRFLSDGRLDALRLRETVLTMCREGADIIDIGACSTRPGSEAPSEEEEWRRLEPALRALRDDMPQFQLSIDTFRADIIQRSADIWGRAFIANDISAGLEDAYMLPTVSRLGLPYIAMHKRGTAMNMQSMCAYADVTSEVASFFDGFAARAEDAGIRDWWLDPGFGFAKNAAQNYQMLRELSEFQRFKRPVLAGISRKSFIYRPLGLTQDTVLPQTQALHALAIQEGAEILRVHDVAAAARTVSILRTKPSSQ